MTVETRYERSDTWTGASPYKLLTTNTTTAASYEIGAGVTYFSIRVSDGTGTIATYVAEGASGNPGTGTWTHDILPVGRAISGRINVAVYARFNGSWTWVESFATEDLTGQQLDAGTWTVYCYYHVGTGANKDLWYYWWGNSTNPSRIEGFAYSTYVPTRPKQILGDGLASVIA